MLRLALIALSLAGGCAVGDGIGTFAGTLYVQECNDNPRAVYSIGSSGAPSAFDLRPAFFIGVPAFDDPFRRIEHNRLAIRVQSSGKPLHEADLVYVNIADVRQVALALGQPMPVGPDTNVRAVLMLNQTCPAHQVEIELDGTMTFTQFGAASAQASPTFAINYGDRVAAAVAVDVVDRRALALGGTGAVPAAPAVSGHFDGSFDFVVRPGRSAQPFP